MWHFPRDASGTGTESGPGGEKEGNEGSSKLGASWCHGGILRCSAGHTSAYQDRARSVFGLVADVRSPSNQSLRRFVALWSLIARTEETPTVGSRGDDRVCNVERGKYGEGWGFSAMNLVGANPRTVCVAREGYGRRILPLARRTVLNCIICTLLWS